MAYSLQPKKMLALNLLELLRKYSDENHRLSQQELLRLLASEYGMTADRKSVRRNLLELQSCGYPVCCDERPRAGADGEDGTFCTGWYIERAFTDAELRLLIDSLLSSRSLPAPHDCGRGASPGFPGTSKARRIFEFMIFSASRWLFLRAVAPYGGLGASTANAQNAHFCQGTKTMRRSEALRPSRGSARPRVGTAPFRNSFFGRTCRYLSKFACDGGALRFISRRRRAPFVPSAVVRRFWRAALRRRGARDGGVSMQKYARRQNRRAYTYFPFSARKIRRTRICG